MTPDTSAEAVERLAAWQQGTPWPDGVPQPPMFAGQYTAATLLALLAERDAARDVLAHAELDRDHAAQQRDAARAEAVLHVECRSYVMPSLTPVDAGRAP